MSRPAPSAFRGTLRRFLPLLQGGIILLVLFFWGRSLWANWETVSRYRWEVSPGYLFLSLFLLLMHIFLLASIWHRSLGMLGVRRPWRETTRLWALAQLARYIPGGIWDVAGRMTMGVRAGYPKAALSVSILLEMVLQAISAAVIFVLDQPWMAAAKRAAFALWPGLKGKLHSSMAYAGVDWSHTRAYAVGTMGNIYLNVRGREPQGIVEMGAEYEALREELIAGLKALRDAETGAPVFLDVYRREDIYHGPYLEEAPDIVGLLDPTYHVAAVDWRPAGGGVIESLGDKLLFVGDLTGQHDLDGILIAHGPHVRAGAPLEGARIIDIAPTILAAMGEKVPAYMDGRVLAQLFDSPLQVEIAGEGHPILLPSPEESGYSAEEAEEIASRLRGLGYLE